VPLLLMTIGHPSTTEKNFSHKSTMASQGCVDVFGAHKHGVKLWVYFVNHVDEVTIELSGTDVRAKLEVSASKASCSVLVGTVRCFTCANGIPLCRWTRLCFRLTRKQLCFVVGEEDASRSLHFAEKSRFSSLHLKASPSVFWSLRKKQPLQPTNSHPTPKRFVEPLTSVDELLKIQPITVVPKQHPKMDGLLVCHDFKGNYLPSDRALDTVFGAAAMSKFAFTHWQLCSWFVYFSHNRVSFPPPSFVAAAKTNMCGLLGTFITEWKEGEEENVKLFSQPEKSAMALAQLAANFSFDGFLFFGLRFRFFCF
jgi:hypothetical protein